MIQWIGIALIALVGLRYLSGINGLLDAYGGPNAEDPPGRRVRRLLILRAAHRNAEWLIGIGVFLAFNHNSTGAITCIGYGLMFEAGVWISRRHRVAPWFAVNLP